MSYATKPFSNRIAVVFDFDETLIPSANYQPDSELMRSLILSIECISKKIALLQLSVGQ